MRFHFSSQEVTRTQEINWYFSVLAEKNKANAATTFRDRQVAIYKIFILRPRHTLMTAEKKNCYSYRCAEPRSKVIKKEAETAYINKYGCFHVNIFRDREKQVVFFFLLWPHSQRQQGWWQKQFYCSLKKNMSLVRAVHMPWQKWNPLSCLVSSTTTKYQ